MKRVTVVRCDGSALEVHEQACKHVAGGESVNASLMLHLGSESAPSVMFTTCARLSCISRLVDVLEADQKVFRLEVSN